MHITPGDYAGFIVEFAQQLRENCRELRKSPFDGLHKIAPPEGGGPPPGGRFMKFCSNEYFFMDGERRV